MLRRIPKYSSLFARNWFSCGIVNRAHFNHRRRFGTSKYNILEKSKPENTSNDNQAVDKSKSTTIAIGVAAALLLAAIIIADDDKSNSLVSEKECESKILADMTPGTHPGSNHIKRVKMTHRLPIDQLVSHGVKHAALEGTLWACDSSAGGVPNTNYIGKVFQQQYWNDEAAYEITPEAAEKLRMATEELHAMCLDAVDTVIESDDLMTLFEIPPNMWNEVRHSWKNRERDLLGRFDFMWDGRGEPKLAEYNADTPTILVETAVGQEMWLSMMKMKQSNFNAWCFNRIESQLLASWKSVLNNILSQTRSENRAILHLTGIFSAVEENEHLQYLGKIAQQAGFEVQYVDMTNIDFLAGKLIAVKLESGSNVTNRVNVDGFEEIKNIFKLYPYEWLAHEHLGEQLFTNRRILADNESNRICWIEPTWKLILGNKAILAVLWQKFPDHPNLLPAFFELPADTQLIEKDNNFSDALDSSSDLSKRTTSGGIQYVAKPKFGREGQGIVYGHQYTFASNFVAAAEQQIFLGPTASSTNSFSPHSKDHIYIGYPIYQAYFGTATFSMRHIVIGSWVIGGVPCGFNIREDSTATTQDSSCFVPHYIPGASKQAMFAKVHGTKFTPRQRQLYKELYDMDITAPAASTSDHSTTSRSYVGRLGSWWKSNESSNGSRSGWEGGGASAGANTGKDSTAAKSTPNDHPFKSTAEKFRARRSQSGAYHHHSSRTTGSSYKVSRVSSSFGGRGG